MAAFPREPKSRVLHNTYRLSRRRASGDHKRTREVKSDKSWSSICCPSLHTISLPARLRHHNSSWHVMYKAQANACHGVRQVVSERNVSQNHRVPCRAGTSVPRGRLLLTTRLAQPVHEIAMPKWHPPEMKPPTPRYALSFPKTKHPFWPQMVKDYARRS